MKIGKKFLSLLMGVAVLLVSSLPAFAAEVETTDCASVSYDYVTEFDDGGKDLRDSEPSPVALSMRRGWEVGEDNANRAHPIVKIMEKSRHIVEEFVSYFAA